MADLIGIYIAMVDTKTRDVEPAHSICPLCTGDMQRLFTATDYRRSSDPRRYAVAWCSRCFYGRVNATLSAEKVAQFYEFDYYTHGTSQGVPVKRNWLERLRRHLAWRFDEGLDLLPEEFGRRGAVIDIGCGSGGNMEKLGAAGFTVVGIEPDPAARAVASRFGTVYQGTAENPPIEVGGGYDYALLSHVLEHTLSPATALACAHDMLRPSGKLVVEVPNCDSKGFELFGPHWPWTDLPRHLHFFTRSSLERFVENAGFAIKEAHYTGFTRQFDVEWVDTINTAQRKIQEPEYSRNWFTRQSWSLLAKTARELPDKKYDSIRIHAVKP